MPTPGNICADLLLEDCRFYAQGITVIVNILQKRVFHIHLKIRYRIDAGKLTLSFKAGCVRLKKI